MWFNLSDEEIRIIERGRASELVALATRLREQEKDQCSEEAQHYRDCVECDADAVVSMGDDDGAYVMTWKWVGAGEFAK